MDLSRDDLVARLSFEDLDQCGERVALQLRVGPTRDHRSVTFRELRAMAVGAAAALIDHGCQPGQRVAVLLPHTHRLVGLFFGAIYGGFVPSILAWPTSKMDAEKYRRNVLAIVSGLKADLLVTEPSMAATLGAVLGETRVAEPGALEDYLAGKIDVPSLEPRVAKSDPLFIQFSGGTTGTQKSVPIELGHLHRQLVCYDEALRLGPDDALISWLPLYHDMGLIACQVLPFVYRLPVTMFAPMDWIMAPGRFLDAVGEDRATLCWLPNFGYSFMAQKVRRDPSKLDLSSLRAVINCSEPVRAESMNALCDRFAPSGLRREAIHTCYAMAEATFAVTQSTDEEPPRWVKVSRDAFGRGRIVPSAEGERVLVSCGKPIPGIEVRVVKPETGEDCAEGEIGEIWLAGEFVMRDYLQAPGAERGPRWAFSDDGCYRTGDLGALLDGHLFVTGRKKDIIIIGGINVFPEDLEARVSEVEGVHPGRAVALGLEDPELGTERLVLVAEANEAADLARASEIDREIRRVVLTICGVAPYQVFVVPPKWIVKSTAGKISRIETRARVLERWEALTSEPELAQ